MDHVCVGAIVVDTNRACLLLAKRTSTRSFYPDVWDMLGGHREPAETPDQTLARELEEEIGITPTKWQPLDTLRLTTSDGDETIVLHIFVVTEWVGTPSNRSPEEHTGIAWLTLEDACKLALADDAYPVVLRAAMLKARGE